MNSRLVVWLVLSATTLPSLALGDSPTPAPAAAPAPAPVVNVSTPAPAAAVPDNSPAVAAPVATPPAPAAPAEAATPSPAPTVVYTPDPVPGDSVATVLAAMGKPNGVINLPDKYLMMFDRGNIVMSLQDIVLETKLTPLAVYTAKLEEEVAAENDRRAAKARVDALLDLLLNDPSYIAMSTRDRLLALARFDREHPGSEAHQDYLDLLAIYAAEQSTVSKVADYQNQAAEAHAQALIAQQQAAAIQQQLQIAQQQTALAQQQAAVSQQQVAGTQQQPVYYGQTTVVRGTPGIVTGPVPIKHAPPASSNQTPPLPMIINNNSVTNVPPQGVQVIKADGTYKFIPGTGTNGNHTVYF